MKPEHHPSFEADRRRFFYSLEEMAIGYGILCRQLEKAGLQRPSTADRPYREHLLGALKAGLRGERLVAEMQRPHEADLWAERLANPGPDCRVAA